MDIFNKLMMIIFWFSVVVFCGTFYVWAIIFMIKKGILGETSAKVVYFMTFVIVAAIVYKLPVFL
jgi:hypothetical protein